MRVRDLDGKKVAIWGAGREAVSVVRATLRAGVAPRIRVLDEQPQPDARVEGIVAEALTTEALDWADVVVRSPGVSKYKPELANRVVTTATSLWFAEPHRCVIAVTGTKGKSTTSSMLAHLLRAAGRDVAYGGNIGHSPLDAFGEREPDYWVLELSSFQVSDLEGHVDVAGFTSFSPEHLDWHGTAEQYLQDKLRLFGLSDRVILNRANPRVAAMVDEMPRAVLSTEYPELPSKLFGRHNQQNIAMARSLLVAAGVEMDEAEVAKAVAEFAPLAHRLEPVVERNGVLWVNDSLSTAVVATIAALEAFPDRPVTLLVGGHDRGISYEPLRAVLESRGDVTVITMPACGVRIAESVPSNTPVLHSDGLADAIRIAREHTPAGGVVLLSPAAASFGEFRDYAERGERFRELARR